MRNPNSFSDAIGNDSEKNNESRATNQKLGNSALRGEAIDRRREELLKEIAELEAKLNAKGVNTEEIKERARTNFTLKNTQKPEPKPMPTPEPVSEPIPEPTPEESEYYEDDEEDLRDAPEVAPAIVAEKIKKNKGIRKIITAAIIGVTAILGTTALGGLFFNKNKKAMAKNPTTTEAIASDDGVIVIPVDSEDIPDQKSAEKAEAIGIKEGYGEEGMWLSESKPNSVAFSDFKSIIDKFNGDVKAAAKYVCDNEVEVKSDYIAGLDAVRPEAFKGLSELEINEKLEHLSPEEFDKISQEFNSILGQADNVKEITLNGKYDNAYMAIKDGKDLVGSKIAKNKNLAVNHETMQLIFCTTNEKGAKAYQLEWHDENGKLIDSIIIKEACAQVVEKEGSNPARFKGIPEVTEVSVQAEAPVIVNTPTVNVTTTVEQKKEEKKVEKKKTTHKDQDKKKDKETPPPDIPPIVPPKDHEQKDEDKEKENAGDHVDQRSIDNSVTSPTTKEEDQRNADEIEKQRQAEEAARQEAERVAEEQRQAEEAARREAENREVADESNEEETRDADQDKERAEDEASREQEEAAEKEREDREEEERREEAQEEANEKDAENQEESSSEHGATMDDRANLAEENG